MNFFINRYKNKISSTPEDAPPIIISNGWNDGVFTDYEYALYEGAGLKYKELHTLLSSSPCNDRLLKVCRRLKIGLTAIMILIPAEVAVWALGSLGKLSLPIPILDGIIPFMCAGIIARIIVGKIAKHIQHIMVDNYNIALLHIRAPEFMRYNDTFSLRTYCLHNKTPLSCAEFYTRIASAADNEKPIKRIRLIRNILGGIGLFLAAFTLVIGKPVLARLSDTFGSLKVVNSITMLYCEAVIIMSMLRALQVSFIEKCVDTYNIALTRNTWEENIEER